MATEQFEAALGESASASSSEESCDWLEDASVTNTSLSGGKMVAGGQPTHRLVGKVDKTERISAHTLVT